MTTRPRRGGGTSTSRRTEVFNTMLRGAPRLAVTALAVALVVAVAALDWTTGSELSFSIFYLAPVSLAAAYAGRGVGLAIALLSAVAWLSADLAGAQTYSSPLIPVWNAGVRLGFFVITCLLVDKVRSHVAVEERLARVDGLTGAMNGRAFFEEGERLLRLAARHGHPLTLGYLDLDNFKCVNDRHGHAAGDRLLRETALGIRRSVRADDLVARLGGDEFALLLPETDTTGTAAVVAKLESCLRPVLTASECAVGYSAGFITFASAPASLEAAIGAADNLMYEVKKAGKGRVLQRAWQAGERSEQPRARAGEDAAPGPPSADRAAGEEEEP